MDKCDQLLLHLQGEIDQKCKEIVQKRAQERLAKFFAVACVLLVILPVTLILAGINPFVMLVPIVLYVSVGILLLSPLLVYKNQERGYTT